MRKTTAKMRGLSKERSKKGRGRRNVESKGCLIVSNGEK